MPQNCPSVEGDTLIRLTYYCIYKMAHFPECSIQLTNIHSCIAKTEVSIFAHQLSQLHSGDFNYSQYYADAIRYCGKLIGPNFIALLKVHKSNLIVNEGLVYVGTEGTRTERPESFLRKSV